MMTTTTKQHYVTFLVNDKLYGLDILNVREINRQVHATYVPLAPSYVHGLINLRGQIVTILDLKRRLGLGHTAINAETHNIILNVRQAGNSDTGDTDDRVGIMVDGIGDIIETSAANQDGLPANLDERDSHYLSGVIKLNDNLVGLLNIHKVLAHDEYKDD
jgi:purine-binding chemotaxis protein CheW